MSNLSSLPNWHLLTDLEQYWAGYLNRKIGDAGWSPRDAEVGAAFTYCISTATEETIRESEMVRHLLIALTSFDRCEVLRAFISATRINEHAWEAVLPWTDYLQPAWKTAKRRITRWLLEGQQPS